MTRVQILLPKEQDRRLEEASARSGESKANVVRRALDRLFMEEATKPDPILELIGQAGRGRQPRASERHDRIVAVAERRQNRRR
jgi:predicted DNA-binding protein